MLQPKITRSGNSNPVYCSSYTVSAIPEDLVKVNNGEN